MQRKEIVERFLESVFINNEKQHLFNEEELFLIYNDKYKLDCILDEDKLKIKLLYLIANFESNLSQDFIIFARNFLNLLNGFYSEKEIENWDYYGIKVKDLIKNTIVINNKKLTLEQTLIYKMMHKTDIFLKAGTGIGKTLISSYFLVERYREYIKNENIDYKNEKFVFIVPTEILEEQIKHNLYKYNEDIKSKIGNTIEENDILIITWDKLAQYIKWDKLTIKINTLILDEAFLLFDKNNDRSLFLKHIIKSYIKNSIDKNKNIFSRIILLSPISPTEENIIELKEIFKDTSHKFKYLDFDTSKDISNKLFINRFDITEINEKKFKRTIEKNTDDSTCIYFENKYKAKKQIKNLYRNDEFIKKIECVNRKIFTQEQINSFFSDKDLKIYEGYNNFEFIKSGICYLTSDTPDRIKNLIISLAEEKYIKIVAATYIIINGVDLPFDNAFLSSNLVNKKTLTTEEIVNFIGRSGRKNKFKKGYSLGNVYIKVQKQNIEWFKKNKKDLINYVENNKEIKNYSTNEINEKLFVKESYQLFEKTNDSSYLIDPRINPETTKFIINNISIEDYRYILSTLTSNSNFKLSSLDKYKNSINEIIIKIFSLYNISDYFDTTNCFQENSRKNFFEIIDKYKKNIYINKNLNIKINEDDQNNKILKHLLKYCEKNMNVDEALISYIISCNSIKDIKNNNDTKTKYIENFVSNVKLFGKFLLQMFINHMHSTIKGCNKKYTSLSVIYNYFIYDMNFYLFLEKNNFLQKILQNLKQEMQIKEWWIKVNSINNDIFDIKNTLESSNIFFNNIEKNNFIDMLDKYICNIKKQENN